MNHPRILFIHLGRSSFVTEDLKILSEFTEVREFFFDPNKTNPKPVYVAKLLWNFIRQFFWLLFNIRGSNLIYCWFSDFHGVLPAFFSKLFKKPMLTVLGGSDCNKIESLDYGVFSSRWRAPLGAYVIKNSTLLLPVNKHLIETDPQAKDWENAHPNGLKYNLPDFRTPWEELPTGYSPELWKVGPIDREPIVTTVANVSNIRTALIKGWDLVVSVAKLLPEYQFRLIGISKGFEAEFKDRFEVSENLTFIRPQNREQLVEYYQQASVYVQLSRVEGMPNVLCEAMMCGCVPVGSPVFGIPTAIGDTGFIAETQDPKDIAALIKEAHERSNEFRRPARERIMQVFNLDQRKRSIKEIISSFEIKH